VNYIVYQCRVLNVTCDHLNNYNNLICIIASFGQSCRNPQRTCVDTNTECGSTNTCVCGSGYVQNITVCIVDSGQFVAHV